MCYFDVILLSDVISSIGPKISDADTNISQWFFPIFKSLFCFCIVSSTKETVNYVQQCMWNQVTFTHGTRVFWLVVIISNCVSLDCFHVCFYFISINFVCLFLVVANYVNNLWQCYQREHLCGKQIKLTKMMTVLINIQCKVNATTQNLVCTLQKVKLKEAFSNIGSIVSFFLKL